VLYGFSGYGDVKWIHLLRQRRTIAKLESKKANLSEKKRCKSKLSWPGEGICVRWWVASPRTTPPNPKRGGGF